MKSVVAIVLSCWILGGSLFPGFSIDQSAHLGDLIQHYQQHRRDNTDLGFTDFINMHYGADSEHQKHPNHSHHNLPSSGHSMPVFTPGVVRLVATPSLVQVLVLRSANFFRTADLYSFLAVFALINPPRK
ncbi:hypothetical protein J2I47_26140 [Fibrella sp. HMF5335]|uniref:Uncharacterized protein n=1 Tax=Fibrella rubiginis TaxID=2817060 RepID=A0A939GP50_9BACT|nr:hypothetical protein [Fibrella rubiginis]MBO0940052.1 hypothetical protein [Fibrella rubiginis]